MTSEDAPAKAVFVASRGHRRRRRFVVAALALSLLFNAVLLATGGEPEVGCWRSAAGKAEYERHYDRLRQSVPTPAAEQYVPTTYGTAHVMRFGNAPGTPVLLMPGWGSGIPMWQENLPALVAGRTVYAVDAIGDAGLSTQSVPFETTADEAAWVAETIERLGLERVHLVGHSFGGRLAAEVALWYPDRVATLSLLEPVQTVAGFPWQVYVWSIPTALPFLPQSWRDGALARIGGVEEVDRSDPMTALIDAGTKHYAPARPFPQQLTDAELASLAMPVYIALGSASSMQSDVEKNTAAARLRLPRGEVEVWQGGTHSLPMEKPTEIGAKLLDFMARAER